MKSGYLPGSIYCLWLALFLSPSITVRADILDSWHWRNPAPFTDTMHSICFGGGKFVAVGDGGVVHASNDGVNWDDGRRPVLLTLNKVIYANGEFIAVGNSGTIIASTNGIDWKVQNSGAVNDLFAVTFGNGRFVVFGGAGQWVTSTDGTNWTAGTDSSVGPYWLTFGNGLFMAAGSGTSVKVSSDGQTWTTVSLPVTGYTWPHALHQVEFGNGTFVAVVTDETYPQNPAISEPASHFYRSTDGTNWTQGTYFDFGPTGFFYHRFFAFLNGEFQELTDGSSQYGIVPITVTTDGTSSTRTYAPTNAPLASSMAYGNGKYALIEQLGKGWISTDETNWVATYGGFAGSFFQIVQGSSNFIVVGPMLVSSDGLTFSSSTTPPGDPMVAAAFDGTNYVAVGGLGNSGPLGTGAVYTSTNGFDWVKRTSNSDKKLLAVCHGPSRWVAVGFAGRLISSPNTLAWTLRSSGTANDLNGVAFGNGIYVAVGNSGTVITSSDGATWDVQFSGTTLNLNGVLFQNGQFIAIGDGGTILTSTDGAIWLSQDSGTTIALYSIAYGDAGYVVCGFEGSVFSQPVKDVFLTSSNSIDWQDVSRKIPTTSPVHSVGYVNQSFWVVGENGMLLQSDKADGVPHLVASMAPGNAGFQLKVTLNPAATYRVQFCTNMVLDSWHDILTQTNPISSDMWTDTNGCHLPSGFYRIVSP